MTLVPHRMAALSASTVLAATLSGPAAAHPATSVSAAPAARPATSARTTLHLPDGKRSAHVWKTWYKNANGKYHGHYGFTSASKGVSVYVVLWTGGGRTRYLPTKGKSYAYSDISRVQLFACDNAYPNGEDCSATW